MIKLPQQSLWILIKQIVRTKFENNLQTSGGHSRYIQTKA
jgi:hypothetical protein